MDTGASEFVWWPSTELVANSHLRQFMDRHACDTFESLLHKSTDGPSGIAWFWDTMLREMGIVFDTPYEQVVDLSQSIQHPCWCLGGRLNITASLLDRWTNTSTDDKLAIRWERENGDHGTITYRELRARVNQAAGVLRQLGLGRGDVVGIYMPMAVECVVAMPAVIRIGGIFLPLFSGYGPAAVATRLQDAQAKAILCCDGFSRRGRHIAMKPVVDQAVLECPNVHVVIVFKRTAEPVFLQSGRDFLWDELICRQPKQAS